MESQQAIKIREATEADNQALIELQARCPQGTNFILGIDSSPDFFARSRAFEEWHVLVATQDSAIVGSAAFAVSETQIEGRRIKTVLEYGFMADPRHRRKGIAANLQKKIEQIALDKNVDLMHLDVMEDNLPSLNLFWKMGFKRVRDCRVLNLIANSEQKVTKQENIRKMESGDINAVTNLINETFRDHDFFQPLTEKELTDCIDRMPHFDLQDILVYDDAEGISACLGCWDYNKIRKYIVEKFSWKMRIQISLLRLASIFTPMPAIRQPGERLLSYNLFLPAFRDPESLTELVKSAIEKAAENQITILNIPLDPESHVTPILSQFRHLKTKLHFLIKPLTYESFSNVGKRRIFIDVSEI
ncbi:MAG: GNAT family N-acetyltransferase [Candidatus Bathyarchaeota archaeon]|nr:MAG: GNAT family N-acetyltransferase [Candidatus Bathyarchaeota archaeon]